MNKKNHSTLAITLTYSGTLPLIGSVFLIYFPLANIDALRIAATYSTMILSFLCGIHWAIYLFFSEKCPRNLLLTSNIIALLAWASLLLISPMTLLLQALSFLYLLTLDLKILGAGLYPDWFYRLRRNATIIVVLCLLTMIVLP